MCWFLGGITSGSEGSCNRDSLRLEEEVHDNIQFCGKAKVHTDFLPSPYDAESLKLKVSISLIYFNSPGVHFHLISDSSNIMLTFILKIHLYDGNPVSVSA